MTAWEEVYNELTKLRMFTGIYDAKHGDEHFMYGIQTVMEVIAERCNKQDEFNEMFAKNVIKSEEKALNAKEKTK